jgi:hypothetical protein
MTPPAAPRRPVVLRCPRCGATVALNVDARAWCLPCGRRMHPDTLTPNPLERTTP